MHRPPTVVSIRPEELDDRQRRGRRFSLTGGDDAAGRAQIVGCGCSLDVSLWGSWSIKRRESYRACASSSILFPLLLGSQSIKNNKGVFVYINMSSGSGLLATILIIIRFGNDALFSYFGVRLKTPVPSLTSPGQFLRAF